jgi:hypothetical protein
VALILKTRWRLEKPRAVDNWAQKNGGIGVVSLSVYMGTGWLYGMADGLAVWFAKMGTGQ